MTVWFYIFIASLAGIVILLSVRAFEEKRGLPRFLLFSRRFLNNQLKNAGHLVRYNVSPKVRDGGTHVVQKMRDVAENPKLRRSVKRSVILLVRLIHDGIVAVLKVLGKVRKRILTFHDRHSD